MKVLVATKQTQGMRPNDFCFCKEGEIVMFPSMECDNEPVDGACGCRRSMVGVETLASTTTMKVADVPIDVHGLADAIYDALEAGGFAAAGFEDMAWQAAEADAQELARIAANFSIGTVVERRGDVFQARLVQ